DSLSPSPSLSSIPIRLPPPSTLFPYTTLFRSQEIAISEPIAERDRLLEPGAGSLGISLRHLPQPREQARVSLRRALGAVPDEARSEEHTSELQSRENLVCRLLLEKKNTIRMVS